MNKIYFFRGKAGTGKTTITNALSKRLNISVLRKDDIFDSIAENIEDKVLNNAITYNVLAKQIQTNIDNNCDIIVDVGLSNTDSFKMFMSKLNVTSSRVLNFWCDCSDMDI